MMTYKGYTGHAVYDDEAGLIHGQVIGIRDVVTYQGMTVDDLRQGFRESIDDYLAMCAEDSVEPHAHGPGRVDQERRAGGRCGHPFFSGAYEGEPLAMRDNAIGLAAPMSLPSL